MLFIDLALMRATQVAWVVWMTGLVQLAERSQSQLTYNQQ